MRSLSPASRLPLAGAFLLAVLLAPAAVAQSTARPAPAAAEASAQEGYLLAARLYTAPDAAAAEAEGVGRDVRVRVVAVPGKDGWFAVSRAGAQEIAGYAFHPYVSQFGPSGITAARTEGGGVTEDDRLPEVTFADEDDGALAVVSEWTNVREGPSGSARAFGVVRPGVPFHVLAVERGWGRVRLEGEPGYGYVSGRLLQRAPESTVVRPEEGLAEEAVPPGPASPHPADAAGDDGAADEADLPPDQITVYVTRTGRRYHREDCTHLRAQRFALPLPKAAADYTPCRVCRPPRM